MAEQEGTSSKGPIKFNRVKKSFNASSGARRGVPKVATAITGLTRSNVEGKDLVINWVKKHGGNPDNFQLTFGANEEAGLLALYLAKEGDEGVMKVTIYRNSVVFHVGGAFAEYPKLRPVTKVDCHISPMTDADGDPCLAVQIAGAAPSRTVKRKSKKTTTPPAQ